MFMPRILLQVHQTQIIKKAVSTVDYLCKDLCLVSSNTACLFVQISELHLNLLCGINVDVECSVPPIFL